MSFVNILPSPWCSFLYNLEMSRISFCFVFFFEMSTILNFLTKDLACGIKSKNWSSIIHLKRLYFIFSWKILVLLLHLIQELNNWVSFFLIAVKYQSSCFYLPRKSVSVSFILKTHFSELNDFFFIIFVEKKLDEAQQDFRTVILFSMGKECVYLSYDTCQSSQKPQYQEGIIKKTMDFECK